MEHVRGLTVWLGAPILASVLCTYGWSVALGGNPREWGTAIAFSPFTMIFTIGGSTVLAYLHDALWAARRIERNLVLIAVGLGLGGAFLAFVTSFWEFFRVGSSYGVVTAALWIALHRVVYGV
jgi:hypothetical protein